MRALCQDPGHDECYIMLNQNQLPVTTTSNNLPNNLKSNLPHSKFLDQAILGPTPEPFSTGTLRCSKIQQPGLHPSITDSTILQVQTLDGCVRAEDRRHCLQNYLTSSDPHHDMSGEGCQVNVIYHLKQAWTFSDPFLTKADLIVSNLFQVWPNEACNPV